MSEIVISKKCSTRNSGVELLRIIAIILIIAFHASRTIYSDSEQSFYIYVSKTVLGSWGLLGVDIFVIISSYYLVDQHFKAQRLINIAFQTFTYVLLYTIVSFVVLIIDKRDFIYSLKEISIYNLRCFWEPLWSQRYWFVTAYFFMLLLSPLLNHIISHTSKPVFKKLLLITLFIPVYLQFNSFGAVGDTASFCFIYLLVGYIKKYNIAVINRFFKLRYIIVIALCIILGKIALYFPIPAFLEITIEKTFALTDRHSVILLALSLCICFFVFSKKPFHNTIINKTAACTLGVYLIHEQEILGYPTTIDLIIGKFKEIDFLKYNLFFPLSFIAIVMIVFICGTSFEYIRQLLIQKPFMNMISSKLSKRLKVIDNWFSIDS